MLTSTAGPKQRGRLEEIRDNLIARIAEADQGWLGEAEGLRVSLVAAEGKLAQLDDLAARGTTIHRGMPHFSHVDGCTIAADSP